ncbi:MAG: ABC transporter ATP-binding protein [Streptococcaceae bacterium]|jgi:ABC-2 type transport system ATP-binding protein|nr:ABC transporter ATP-binding protein [Streptococcaceae bacterium]
MKNLIEIENVSKHYGTKKVLEGIDLVVPRGQIVALLGENGAGKTTLINLINHLAQPSAGKITVELAQARIGVMLQSNITLDRVTVREALNLARSYYQKSLPYVELLRLADLAAQEAVLTQKLSGGQKRRLTFALAMAGDPELIFLDEPTTGMDAERREAFWQEITRLQARGKTFFITSHYLEELENIATRLILLTQHQIGFDGTLSELRAQNVATEIHFNFDGDLSALTELASVKKTGNFYTLTTNDTNALVTQLVPYFAHGLTNLTIQQNSLDNLFKNLVENQDVKPTVLK